MNEQDPNGLSRGYAPPQPTALVPAVFAEKAMASLMQLHGELMDEKERRVDLYRRLMEREQSLAELKMYVRMLEEKLGTAPAEAARAEPSSASTASAPPPERQAAPPPRVAASGATRPNVVQMPPRQPANVRAAPPPRPPPPHAPVDGWKAW